MPATSNIAGDHARTMRANAAAAPPRRETISRLEEERLMESVAFTVSSVQSVRSRIPGRLQMRPPSDTCSRFIVCVGAPSRESAAPRVFGRHDRATA